MSSYEISKSSLLSLKAEILRKQQELVKAKADNEVKIKIIKKNTPLEIKNKGIESRQKNDLTEDQEDLLKKSRSVLEAKSKLYEKLSSGKLTEEEIQHNKRYLVRFDKKNNSQDQNLSQIDFDDSEPDKYPESDEDCYNSDEDDTNNDPGERWVDYTDCLGRTRKCLQKDLEYLKSKDEELKKTVEGKNKNNSSDKEQSDKHEEDNIEEKNENKKIEDSNETLESELLSNDMRRELLRKQWEKEEDELRNKSNIHYQDILFGEARTHGVGYYGFSKDEEERAKQQEALKILRNETEMKQKRAQELRSIREKQLAARIKAAKDRKRARLGLPPEEEDMEEVIPQPEVAEEEKKKQDELRKQEEEKERLLEEARKKHLRPWDVGKEGVKEHYVMSQEEWVDKKRDERQEEFAPPQAYHGRKFRSSEKISDLEETDKSLKFTTKKKKSRSKNKKGKYTSVNFSREIYEDTANNVHRMNTPTPIEDLCEESDFDDRLLTDFKKSMQSAPDNDIKRSKGVEIAPPCTYDYYGPSDTKRAKFTKPEINIQSSIEAGLKFLRNQVEEKQKSTRQRGDYDSIF